MDHGKIITSIEQSHISPVRDPLWKHIYLSRGLEKIIHSSPFIRLSSIKQLGPAVLVYPGATHTRANHSLGVFHLAKRIIVQLLADPRCPKLTMEGVNSFLAASLLHDLGHFPYAHVLEDDLSLRDHEELSGEYVLGEELSGLLENELGVPPRFVAAIIDQNLEFPQGSAELQFYRKLLSGVLDPDKLDYLNRDAYFCGIPYGIQDIDFVISQIIPDPHGGMGIAPKGVMAVENILFSKYLMYKSVYWHKGVRTTSAVVKKALTMALQQKIIQPEDLYPTHDRNFAATLGAKGFAPLENIAKAETPWVFRTLHEESLEDQNFFHERLKDRATRMELEEHIASELSKIAGKPIPSHMVCVDVPRAISFEVGLPIISEEGKSVPFTESGTVFDRMVVSGFTRSLKKLRIIGPAFLEGKLGNIGSQLFHA